MRLWPVKAAVSALDGWMQAMKLPQGDQAVVPERKITEYLLSPTHRVGPHEAAFFARFGFDVGAWQTLATALQRHATDHDVTATEQTPFGTRYAVEGPLVTPDGRAPLRSVWFVESGETVPRLVTA